LLFSAPLRLKSHSPQGPLAIRHSPLKKGRPHYTNGLYCKINLLHVYSMFGTRA
jgi:hypothetical protein